MICPTLYQLPPAPSGKTGWPWTVESSLVPDSRPDKSLWPKISIITPSFNQDHFIEETIRSVLLQGYPNIEYIIIDGGSTDRSVDIIKKYEPWLYFWSSEPDNGQSAAINKGVQLAQGDIIAWINSDDMYQPNVFAVVVENLFKDGKLRNTIIFSDCDFIDENGAFLYHITGKPVRRKNLLQYWKGYFIPQPTVFFPGPVLKAYPLNENLHHVMDWDLWLRLVSRYEFFYIPETFAKYRNHTDSKWGKAQAQFLAEHRKSVHRHFKGFLDRSFFFICHGLWKIRQFYHNRSRLLFIKILRLFITEKSFSALRSFKKKYFYFLSKKR